MITTFRLFFLNWILIGFDIFYQKKTTFLFLFYVYLKRIFEKDNKTVKRVQEEKFD